METVGIGIIGSRFAAHLHAHALNKLRGSKCEIVAVCARTREIGEAFARKLGVPHVYTDHRALLERKDVHLVDLALPTNPHHSMAIHAANAGKHVIRGKPLTGYFGEGPIGETVPRQTMFEGALRNADAVLEACGKSRVTLCYAENFVYTPPVAKLRRQVVWF